MQGSSFTRNTPFCLYCWRQPSGMSTYRSPRAFEVSERMEETMMARRLRPVFVALATLAVCAPAQWSAQAQAPGGPIKFIITHSPGGAPDTVARVVGRRLQERL